MGSVRAGCIPAAANGECEVGVRIVTVIVVLWLLIGLAAAFQRGYFGSNQDVSCKTAGDTVLTILAGPLNYVGVNPKVDCKVPQPSK